MATKRVKLPRRTARLVFDGEYEGVEVVTRLDVSIDTLLTFMRVNEEDAPPEPGDWLTRLKDFARDALVEWNLEDDGGSPIPATAAGMGQVPPAFANLVIGKWVEAVANPPAPLPAASGGGGTSGTATIATGILSANPGG